MQMILPGKSEEDTYNFPGFVNKDKQCIGE